MDPRPSFLDQTTPGDWATWRAHALADMRRLVYGIAAALVVSLTLVLPVLVRAACVAAALAGAAFAAPRVWSAFGADPVAVLPATVVVLLPLAASQMARLSWGGLLAAGALTAGLGAVTGAADAPVRALLVTGALAVVVYHYHSAGAPAPSAHERSPSDEQGQR